MINKLVCNATITIWKCISFAICHNHLTAGVILSWSSFYNLFMPFVSSDEKAGSQQSMTCYVLVSVSQSNLAGIPTNIFSIILWMKDVVTLFINVFITFSLGLVKLWYECRHPVPIVVKNLLLKSVGHNCCFCLSLHGWFVAVTPDNLVKHE